MADNKTPKTLVTVKRNEVEMDFVETFKVRGAPTLEEALKKDSEDKYPLLKGQSYPSIPQPATREDFDKFISWFDWKKAAKALTAKVNQLAQGIYEDLLAEHEGGEVPMSEFATEAARLSGRGEKLSVLQDQLLEILDQVMNIDVSTTEGIARHRELCQEMGSIKNDINAKRRKSKDDAAASENSSN
jgi:hypothetical protein